MTISLKQTSRGLRAKACATTVALFAAIAFGSAHAARTDITIGMQLEPPNLDPTLVMTVSSTPLRYNKV